MKIKITEENKAAWDEQWKAAHAYIDNISSSDASQLTDGFKIRRKNNNIPASFMLIGNQLYMFGETLGEGKYGKVKKVVDVDGNVYAIKRENVISNSNLDETESNIMKELSRNLGSGDRPTQSNKLPKGSTKHYTLMPYVDGVSLHNFIKSNTFIGLSDKEKHEIALNFLNALNALHKKGVIHSDLHSNNIIINPTTYDIEIIDFGFGTQLLPGKTTATHRLWTQNDAILKHKDISTYFAPETIKDGTVSAASDIWKISSTLRELLGYHELAAKMKSSNPEDRPNMDSIITELKTSYNKIVMYNEFDLMLNNSSFAFKLITEPPKFLDANHVYLLVNKYPLLAIDALNTFKEILLPNDVIEIVKLNHLAADDALKLFKETLSPDDIAIIDRLKNPESPITFEYERSKGSNISFTTFTPPAPPAPPPPSPNQNSTGSSKSNTTP